MDTKTLHILWTNDNPVTAELMVFMYAVNSLKKGWWADVHVIVWGAAAKLLCSHEHIQGKVREFQALGGHVSACRRCAEELGLAEQMEQFGGIELIYMGEPLTRIIRSGEALLTI